jgi:hypothetical protein
VRRLILTAERADCTSEGSPNPLKDVMQVGGACLDY